MVERYVSDDRNQRIDNVGGIESSAHSDFEHRDLHPNAGEVLERHDRQHLKEAGMPRQLARTQQLLGSALDPIVNLAELNVGNGLAVDPDALIDAHQVRRAVKSSLVSRRAQDRRQRGRGRAFAIGPGHQYAGKTSLRIAQRRQHLPHIRQVELVRRSAGQLMPELVKLINRGLVGHANTSDYIIVSLVLAAQAPVKSGGRWLPTLGRAHYALCD